MSERETGTHRIFQVIEILAKAPNGVSFNEIRRLAGDLAPATLSRLLRNLVDDGMIEKKVENGPYFIGSTFQHLARLSLGLVSRADIVRPILKKLATFTTESAAFFELIDDGMRLVAKEEEYESFHYMDEGFTFGPLVNDPFGLVCVGLPISWRNIPPEKREILESYEDQLIPASEEFKNNGVLMMKRKLRVEVLRVVAPVSNKSGDVIGSLGITAIEREFDNSEIDRFKTFVKQAADEATREMKSIGN